MSPVAGLQAKGAQLVSVTSVQGCKLAQQCHMAIHLPLERELCPFDMAPVTSTALQLIWGDTLAIALMQVCQCTRELLKQQQTRQPPPWPPSRLCNIVQQWRPVTMLLTDA